MGKAIKEGRENIDSPLDELSTHLEVVMDGIKVLDQGLAARQAPERPELEMEVDKEAVKRLLQEMARLRKSI